jgi:hypothetical protein
MKKLAALAFAMPLAFGLCAQQKALRDPVSPRSDRAPRQADTFIAETGGRARLPLASQVGLPTCAMQMRERVAATGSALRFRTYDHARRERRALGGREKGALTDIPASMGVGSS